MDREKIITVIIGLIIGALLAGGYFLGPKLLPRPAEKQSPVSENTLSQNQTASPPALRAKDLTLSFPDDNSSTTNTTVTVSGKSPTPNPVIIYANADEKIATPDAEGNFAADIKLEDGENEITVSTFDQNDKIVTIKRNVTLEVSE
ncbi:MAG: hypothetical protein UY21_C0009G0046 [Microgenomates group bacterium GW2011_GWA1_48_10]|nr:MAG: hypothetical protein UY21_C0009G0046 [Microgenomates group bacterium GW2011_GWA1_48_10]